MMGLAPKPLRGRPQGGGNESGGSRSFRPPGSPALPIVAAALAILAGIGIWELAAWLRPDLVVSIPEIARRIWADSSVPGGLFPLWPTVGVTFLDTAIGFGISLVLGVVLGVAMGTSKAAHRIIDMYLYWLLAVPELALVPLYVVLFGFGILSRVMLMVSLALPVIAQRTYIGIISANDLKPMADSYECVGATRIKKILLPAAVPSFFIGARLGLARSVLGVIAAGFLFKLFGLGGSLFYWEEQFETGQLFTYLVVLVILTLAILRLIRLLGDKVAPWQTTSKGGEGDVSRKPVRSATAGIKPLRRLVRFVSDGRILSVIVLAALWQLVVTAAHVNAVVMPPVSTVIRDWFGIVGDGSLLRATGQTMEIVTIGFIVAVVVGVPLGIAAGKIRWVGAAVNPYLSVILSTPFVAFLPVMILWWGTSTLLWLVAAIQFSLPYVVFNAQAGASEVPRSYIEMAAVFEASKKRTLFAVILPGASESVLLGLQQGFSQAIKGVVIAQLLTSEIGLGGLILEYGDAFRMGHLLAVVASAVILVLLVNALFSSLRWAIFNRARQQHRAADVGETVPAVALPEALLH